MSTPPQQPHQPYPTQQAPSGPPPRNKGSLVRAIIVAVCVVAVAVIAVVAVSRNSDSSDKAESGSGDGRTVHRPGYADGLDADPAPMKESAPAAPVTYRGTKVVQACNLLSLADLKQLGVQIGTNSLPNTVNFERRYLAAGGNGPLSATTNGFASGNGFSANHCNFAFIGTPGSSEYVEIAVSQAAYVPGADLDLGVAAEDYTRKANIGNVVVYSHRDDVEHPGDARGDAVLRLGGVTVNVTFDLTAKGVAPKLNDIATTIGKNLSAQVAAPQGPRSIIYRSPVFPESVAQPCPLLTQAAFSSAYHLPLSPLVTENPGTSVGTTTFPNDPQPYDYVELACERGTGQDDPGARHALYLESTSYLSATPAKKNLAFGRQNHQGTPTSVPLGDESIVENGGTGVASAVKGVLLFRKGRFVFELRIADQSRYPNGLATQQANSILVPAARQILQRFGNQQ